MKTKSILYSLLVSLTILSASCGNRQAYVTPSSGDTVKFEYAEHISAVRYDGYTVVTLANPWKKRAVLHRYVLVDRNDSARVGRLPEGTVVYTPVMRSVVFTSPHCYLLEVLGASSVIKGVCDLQYINLHSIRVAASRGKIADCGNSMSPSVERVASLQPQAVFVSPFEGAGYGQIDHIGTPIIECADYMETSALGRAEWMRFYGMLVGRTHEADSLFRVVEGNYARLRNLAAQSKSRPKVITERVASGVWYCPGGNSSMGKLISDAGGHYVFSDDSHSGSLTLSPEKVLSKASTADCWLFVGSGAKPMTRGQLLGEYSGYKVIKAFRESNVYECLPSLHNLYFEQTSFRPDFLLMDLMRIFHPEHKLGGKLHYYNRIK